MNPAATRLSKDDHRALALKIGGLEARIAQIRSVVGPLYTLSAPIKQTFRRVDEHFRELRNLLDRQWHASITELEFRAFQEARRLGDDEHAPHAYHPGHFDAEQPRAANYADELKAMREEIVVWHTEFCRAYGVTHDASREAAKLLIAFERLESDFRERRGLRKRHR
jgi:hypothetical protein